MGEDAEEGYFDEEEGMEDEPAGAGLCLPPAGLARARRTLGERMKAEKARWNREHGATMATAAAAVEEARSLPPGATADARLVAAVRKKRQLCNQRSAAASRASQRAYIDALERELQQL
ncbi:hypothetical protein I4F81_009862 [Pyropia yezoensis]|uniref:Uncharacterized protein n=1 Tax=Pyropia yezoensis TaxID=2788 RepID=A0ACC3CB88_PYRYE|nr:hypothetical protein I4F81_009862 [Neopyropia yezoensis]